MRYCLDGRGDHLIILWSLWGEVDVLKVGFLGQRSPGGQTWDLKGELWSLICSHIWDRKAHHPSATPLCARCVWPRQGSPCPRSHSPHPGGHLCQPWWMIPVTSQLWTLETKPPELYGCGLTVRWTLGVTVWVWSLLRVQLGSLGSLSVPRRRWGYSHECFAACWASPRLSQGAFACELELALCIKEEVLLPGAAKRGIPEVHESALVTRLRLPLPSACARWTSAASRCQVPRVPVFIRPASSLRVSPVR